MSTNKATETEGEDIMSKTYTIRLDPVCIVVDDEEAAMFDGDHKEAAESTLRQLLEEGAIIPNITLEEYDTEDNRSQWETMA